MPKKDIRPFRIEPKTDMSQASGVRRRKRLQRAMNCDGNLRLRAAISKLRAAQTELRGLLDKHGTTCNCPLCGERYSERSGFNETVGEVIEADASWVLRSIVIAADLLDELVLPDPNEILARIAEIQKPTDSD